MSQFALRVKKTTLIGGKEITPLDNLAVIEIDPECNCNSRDILSMLQFGSATLTRLDDDEPEEVSSSEGETGEILEPNIVDGHEPDAVFWAEVEEALNAEQFQALLAVGQTPQALVEYLTKNGSFVSLEGVGKKTSDKLVAALEEHPEITLQS